MQKKAYLYWDSSSKHRWSLHLTGVDQRPWQFHGAQSRLTMFKRCYIDEMETIEKKFVGLNFHMFICWMSEVNVKFNKSGQVHVKVSELFQKMHFHAEI